MELDSFGAGQGYLKAGFLGFNKSGKTHSAMLLALELRKRLGLTRPIAIFDTEASGEYIAPRIRKETGKNPIGKKSRALVDLLDVARQCQSGAADVLIVDSITHVWREVCNAYLDQVNKARDQMGKPRRNRLEFQDWNQIKEIWSRWTDFYLNSQLHIIICGRAGYEWDFEEHEDASGTVRKELVKTGVKMKVESEFGFEPSLLVQMERVQVADNGKFRFVHRASVLGDRFDVMDGATIDNPTGEWFAPHLDMLNPGVENSVDTELKTDMGVDERGDAAYQRERKEKTALLEQIENEIVLAYPGQSAIEKRTKALLVKECFNGSWTAVQGLSLASLRTGLGAVRDWIAKHPAAGKKEE